MAFVKILCDDRFDENLTYQIDGEIAGNYNGCRCEKCQKYEECQGWAAEFGRCEFDLEK